MEYMTAAETASKWRVSLRQVQRLAAESRIFGARKHGHEYLIPKNAKKPGDPRPKKEESSFSREIAEVFSSVPLFYPVENPKTIPDMTGYESFRVLPEIWISYPMGDFECVKRLYNRIKNNAVKLIASGSAIAAAVSLGDYPFYTEIESYLNDTAKKNYSPDITAYAEFQLSVAYIGMSISDMAPQWFKSGDFGLLHEAVKPAAAYMRVQYLSQQKNPESMLAAAQAYLSVYSTENAVSNADTYLRILCAEACCMTGREQEAKAYLRSAMKKNLPHGFISPFAERAPMMGGLCERMLSCEFPESYEAVTGQWDRVTKNWAIFHNRFTKDNIAFMLPGREYQMARLAAHGYTDRQIAGRFALAPGTIKNKLDKIYEILDISGSNRKKELAKFII